MPKEKIPILPPRWEFLFSVFISFKKSDLLIQTGNSTFEVPVADIAKYGVFVMKFK